MKREIVISLSGKDTAQETQRQTPEEVTLYGKGAGLYSYLNILARKLEEPGFSRQTTQVKQ